MMPPRGCEVSCTAQVYARRCRLTVTGWAMIEAPEGHHAGPANDLMQRIQTKMRADPASLTTRSFVEVSWYPLR